MTTYNTQLVEQKLSTLLKNWAKVDQAWWVNAVLHSVNHAGKFELTAWVTTTGKDEMIYGTELVGA